MTYQYEEKNLGHNWLRNEDGDIDIFGYQCGEYHNGPICTACGYGFCHHCQELPSIVCTKIIDVITPPPAGETLHAALEKDETE